MNFSTYAAGSDLLEAESLRQIEAVVHRELRGRIVNFRLVFHSDGIILQGKVGSYHVKQLVLHAVMKATSLPIRRIEVSVDPN